jgi:thymidylate synthase (FAD)
MKIVKQSAIFKWSTPNPLYAIVDGAKTAYKRNDSNSKMTDVEFIKVVLLSKEPQHISPLEQADATYHVITNRAIANEIVRHRMASYVQESTRYCNYSQDRFDNQCHCLCHMRVLRLRSCSFDCSKYFS